MSLAQTVRQKLPLPLQATLGLRAFGLTKVPMLLFISPTVVEIDNDHCVVRVPLNRRNKNHLNSMYFGVLACGADCAGGLMAYRLLEESGKKSLSLVFKDFHAEFLKRAEGDVLFTCNDGQEIRDRVRKTLETGERQNFPVHVTATVPSKLGAEPVARFTLTLSIKAK